MDFFGIGAAVKGAVQIYFASARRTGRTSSLLSCVKDGDHVVFSRSAECRIFRNLCKERNKHYVNCIVVEPRFASDVLNRPSKKGRTYLHHDFVQDYYEFAIDRAMAGLADLQNQASNPKAEDCHTRKKTEVITQWNFYS